VAWTFRFSVEGGESLPEANIRAVILQVINEENPTAMPSNSLQISNILSRASERLDYRHDQAKELAILRHFYDLFRTGYLAWGFNLSNPGPPFFHVTEHGRRTLSQLTHDPGNPDGYLAHVYAVAQVNDVTKSYLEEGLRCYVQALYKAGAVMVGAAAESVIVELKDSVQAKMKSLGHAVPKGFNDWKTKTVLDALKSVFDTQRANFPRGLRDEYDGYWSAFIQQIRAARNEAGHPSSMGSISEQTIQASLLIFPSLLKLAADLKHWIEHNMT
jgi:hypothetical protein